MNEINEILYFFLFWGCTVPLVIITIGSSIAFAILVIREGCRTNDN